MLFQDATKSKRTTTGLTTEYESGLWYIIVSEHNHAQVGTPEFINKYTTANSKVWLVTHSFEQYMQLSCFKRPLLYKNQNGIIFQYMFLKRNQESCNVIHNKDHAIVGVNS